MTLFADPLKVGVREPGHPLGSNLGTAVVAQTKTIQAATLAAVSATFYLPANSQIVNIYGDSTVAWTATTASLTVGTAAAGTQYVTGFDVKTVTRGPTAAFTAAQLNAMSNIGANTTLVATVTSTVENATGTTIVTVLYIPGS